MTKTHLVIGAGGILGISVLGALKALDLPMAKIEMFVGSSVGAMISLALAIGLEIDELYQQALDTDFQALIRPSFKLLMSNYGLDTGEVLMDFLAQKYSAKEHDIRAMTFRTLFAKYGKKLVMAGGNITTGQTEWFGPDETPDMPVLVALRHSISVPILLTPPAPPILDGGLYASYPIEYCIDRGVAPECIQGIMMFDRLNYNSTDLVSYLYSIISTVIFKELGRLKEKYAAITICIGGGAAGIFGSLRFTVSRAEKEELFELGRKSVLLEDQTDNIRG